MTGHFSFITDPYHNPNGSRRHDTRTTHAHNKKGEPRPSRGGVDDFMCIDGEGVTLPDGTHRYVLLGCGEEQIENGDGLFWWEIFDFLYARREERTAYVGFYLGYDFTQWLRSLPQERAHRLLTKAGRDARRSRSNHGRGRFLPVGLTSPRDGRQWQVDCIGTKRLSIRPHCGCLTEKCDHTNPPWMHICDAGGFFQTSFLNVINPKEWGDDPVVTEREYDTIVEGKAARASATLDDNMRDYNRLENRVFARVMRRLDSGLRDLGVTLAASQWFGPGQAASSWLAGRAPNRTTLGGYDDDNNWTGCVPEPFYNAAQASYYGGWFEIMAHGIVQGVTHEYDINSAYPRIISELPCLEHGHWSTGTGTPPEDGYTLVRARVQTTSRTADTHKRHGIGAMLHRDHDGRISRPLITEGWYWWHEVQSAMQAGCVSRRHVQIFEWHSYSPCTCKPPVSAVATLYAKRLAVGKKTPVGKACKLIMNSCYGKFAQSVGSPRYANPIYASLITAECRTMILDAIATHPGGKHAVVMVATDAVFFTSPHPHLSLSDVLGEWGYERRSNLTLFKPGVYWDDAARQRIMAGEIASFKARGISAADFSRSIADVDAIFQSWVPGRASGTVAKADDVTWPKVTFRSSFAMVTALQALTRNDWDSAGSVTQGVELVQSADPYAKRCMPWYDTRDKLWRSEPWFAGSNAQYAGAWSGFPQWAASYEGETFASVPYAKRFGLDDPWSQESQEANGITSDDSTGLGFSFIMNDINRH